MNWNFEYLNFLDYMLGFIFANTFPKFDSVWKLTKLNLDPRLNTADSIINTVCSPSKFLCLSQISIFFCSQLFNQLPFIGNYSRNTIKLDSLFCRTFLSSVVATIYHEAKYHLFFRRSSFPF